jgi:hypothetical protein
MWVFWWTEWHWDSTSSQLFGFSVSVSLHCFSPYTCVIWGWTVGSLKAAVRWRSLSPNAHEQRSICNVAVWRSGECLHAFLNSVFDPQRKYFSSSFFVQRGSGAHQASCQMDTDSPFPGVRRGWGVTLINHPHPVSSSWTSRSYTSSPPNCLHGL